MDFLVTFLEGIITFVSPCMLPMLPIYLAYFAGGSSAAGSAAAVRPVGPGAAPLPVGVRAGGGVPDDGAGDGKRGLPLRTVANACGFVLGFTLVFVAMGAFAGTVGSALVRYSAQLNVVCGLVVVVFGLSFAGVLNIPLLQRVLRPDVKLLPTTFSAAVVFGVVFSIGWTPCVGAYLGSALMLASAQASAARGVALLLAYSLGLGIPFVVSAVAVDQLAGAFGFVKRHYPVVNMVCGMLLVAVGILMATGQMNVWLAALSA